MTATSWLRRWFASAAPVFTGVGRIDRRTYLPGAVGVLLAQICLVFAIQLSLSPIPSPAIGLGAILIVWSWVTLTVRRAHDFGKPGWMILLMLGAWLFLIDGVSRSVPEVGIVLALLPFIAIGVTPGDFGVNRFGVPPRYKAFRLPLSMRKTEPEEIAG